jgi:Zn ribbon nucleic-acid-binding protein
MNSETKSCQNCRSQFTIEPDDFSFYEKLKVPPPTWCPECRLIRRLVWRNERTLYRRQCMAPGHSESLLSNIAPEKPCVAYDQKYWWSDEWDATAYGRDYDFSRPFFAQLKELREIVPLPCLQSDYATLINSEYSNWSGQLRNGYLLTDADFVEDSAYSSSITKSKNCFDCDQVLESELCYDCFDIEKCYRTVCSYDCNGCADMFFSMNCSSCTNCFGCVNLRGKSYHIFNEPYSKEAYTEKLREFFDGSYDSYRAAFATVVERSLRHPWRFARGFMNTNVTGSYVYNSKNTKDSFLVSDVEDSRFTALIHCPGTKGCYDYTDWGDNAQLLYECMTTGMGASNTKFSFGVFKESRDCSFSVFCVNSSDLLGCISLRKKQHCILNKQYTKEEYESLAPKIIEHMRAMPYTDAKGRVYGYGEYFPPDISPFAYNETIAQELFPLTKGSAVAAGFAWRDPDQKSYTITRKSDDVPQRIDGVSDGIVEDVIECGHSTHSTDSGQASSWQAINGACNHNCSTAFRIIPYELGFYRRMNLPLPRLCPNCRHYERIAFRNPMRLWHRTCQCSGRKSEARSSKSETFVYENSTVHFHGAGKCPNEFETSYAPERPEIVYCENCYNAEVA